MARAPHSRYGQKALKSRSVSLNKSETVKGHQKFEVRALSTPETVYDDVLHTFSHFLSGLCRVRPVLSQFLMILKISYIFRKFPEIFRIQKKSSGSGIIYILCSNL